MKIQYLFGHFILVASDQKGKCDKIHRSDWLTGNRSDWLTGNIPQKRSVLQNPDQERTNQSTGICLRLSLPYNNGVYSEKLVRLQTADPD